MAASKELVYKGHPLRRKDNIIYFGSMADKYIIMLQILETKKTWPRRCRYSSRAPTPTSRAATAW